MRDVTVADRDAAPELLDKLMGWPAVCRVWLPQWINDRDTVLARIGELLANPTEPTPTANADDNPPRDESSRVAVHPEFSSLSSKQPIATVPLRVPNPALQRALVPTRTTTSADSPTDFVPYHATVIGSPEDIDALPHDRRVQQLVRRAIEDAIEFEGPIEIDRLLRLVHNRFGLQRVSGGRKQLMIRFVPKDHRVTRFGGTRFYWPSHLDPDTCRGFRRSQGSTDRQFNEIAPEEIANAILAARRQGRARDIDEVHQVARDLGYGRITENIKSIIDRAVR